MLKAEAIPKPFVQVPRRELDFDPGTTSSGKVSTNYLGFKLNLFLFRPASALSSNTRNSTLNTESLV